MSRLLVTLAAASLCLARARPDHPVRPKITGIDHVRIYATNVDKSSAFYTTALGLPSSGGNCARVSK